MSEDGLRDVLEQFPFFHSFTDEEKTRIANKQSHLVKYGNNDYIIRQGETDRAVFILLKGNAAVTRDESPHSIINNLKSGSVFGEMSYLAHRPRSTNVVARGEALVLKMDRELLESLPPETQSKFKDNFIQVLVRRIDLLNQSVLSLKGNLETAFKSGCTFGGANLSIPEGNEETKRRFEALYESGHDMQKRLETIIDEIDGLLKQ